jgi:hypothetical protein
MSISKPKPAIKFCVKENRLNDQMPSKYTFADLSNFHRTVIAILTHNKPDNLAISDLTTVMNFIYIVTDLIDSPQIFNYNVKASKQVPCLSPSPFPYPKIKGLGTLGRSKKCLNALIKWMREVIIIQDLTLEMLLDEYYSKFPYALKPSAIPKGRPVNPHPLKNKKRVLVNHNQ